MASNPTLYIPAAIELHECQLVTALYLVVFSTTFHKYSMIHTYGRYLILISIDPSISIAQVQKVQSYSHCKPFTDRDLYEPRAVQRNFISCFRIFS